MISISNSGTSIAFQYDEWKKDEAKSLQWMLIISANLPKQAWGEALNAGGDI